MKRYVPGFCVLAFFVVFALGGRAFAAAETINIMCWEGYADKAVIDEFKALVK